jgi:hypothetical protein
VVRGHNSRHSDAAGAGRGVEAVLVLSVGQSPWMRCSLNPLGAEEELVEPLRVDEVAVAGGDPGRLLGLDERPDEGARRTSQPPTPAAVAGSHRLVRLVRLAPR